MKIHVADDVKIISGRHAGKSGMVIDTDVFNQPGRVKYMKVMLYDKDKTPVVVVETHVVYDIIAAFDREGYQDTVQVNSGANFTIEGNVVGGTS